MPNPPSFGTLDVSDFTVGAMLRLGIAIRRIARGSDSLEQAADAVVRYLYDHCVDPVTGERSCALVRFYKTHPYSGLDTELQARAAAQLHDAAPDGAMRCLTLLATVGDEPEWNSRHQSRRHRVIALPSVEIVREAPMIARLIEEIGLDIEAVVSGDALAPLAGGARNYDVFHVEEARGSPYIPAQSDFVVPYAVQSVVGFGGLLKSDELFAVILFSRRTIPARSAARFRAIALDVRSALFSLDGSRVWRG
jgi:hypothetical protein